MLREGAPFRSFKYNNLQQCVQKVKYDYKGDEPFDVITKIIYNPNGTVNTKLFYVNNEFKASQKIFYK
ncbi:hypothetical protein [Mucilaginibacter sp. OK283]|uniref:hypothetical protein n=1 Tax=Mucilaginibacter sp. OK283 TaxID=1881049 RepID=UPI00115F979C|nr:hypothetical protein [Mucilaginibacter sp. OK283]